jgi:hypothetical protein
VAIQPVSSVSSTSFTQSSAAVQALLQSSSLASVALSGLSAIDPTDTTGLSSALDFSGMTPLLQPFLAATAQGPSLLSDELQLNLLLNQLQGFQLQGTQTSSSSSASATGQTQMQSLNNLISGLLGPFNGSSTAASVSPFGSAILPGSTQLNLTQGELTASLNGGINAQTTATQFLLQTQTNTTATPGTTAFLRAQAATSAPATPAPLLIPPPTAPQPATPPNAPPTPPTVVGVTPPPIPTTVAPPVTVPLVPTPVPLTALGNPILEPGLAATNPLFQAAQLSVLQTQQLAFQLAALGPQFLGVPLIANQTTFPPPAAELTGVQPIVAAQPVQLINAFA